MDITKGKRLRIAIGIDDLFGPVPEGGGQGRVIINLIENLASIDSDSEYTLYTTRRITTIPESLSRLPENFRVVQIPARSAALRFLQWHVLGRPFIERWIGPQDIVHATTPSVVPGSAGAKLVLTVYDLVWWRFPSGLNWRGRFFHRTGLRRAIRRGAALVSISHATKADILDLIGAEEIRGGVHTFHIAAAERSSPKAESRIDLKERYGITKPYVVTIGTLEPRKNHRRLLEAFAMLPDEVRSGHELVIIGAVGWKVPAIRDMIHSLGLDDSVRWMGHIPDSEMASILAGAVAMAYPSLYEGFGLPILEAMRLGVPVLTSNISSMPEVAGDAALLVDPYSSAAIASGLARLLTDSRLRESLVALGTVRCRAFSFRAMATSYLALYKQLVRCP